MKFGVYRFRRPSQLVILVECRLRRDHSEYLSCSTVLSASHFFGCITLTEAVLLQDAMVEFSDTQVKCAIESFKNIREPLFPRSNAEKDRTKDSLAKIDEFHIYHRNTQGLIFDIGFAGDSIT